MKLFKKITQIFKKQSLDQEPDVLFPGIVSAKQFAAFKPDQRMQVAMIVGDSGDVKFYDFIKWCIEEDTDLGVRLAALKRLPNYIGHTDLPSFLVRLNQSTDKAKLEPYLSMALSKVGLITYDELNNRLNDS
jgi:hypothetical protein